MKKVIPNFFICLILISFISIQASLELADHEKWWENTCGTASTQDSKLSLQQFGSWLGDQNSPSRILVQQHIAAKNYKSVLDVPCGVCIDYPLFKKNCPNIYYLGVDLTPAFVDNAIKLGIPAQLGKIQELPCLDSSFEVTYARHILEHLDSYEDAIKELVRVAKKEVIIVFFIPPHGNESNRIFIKELNGYPIYHNRYSKSQIESFLKSLKKVKNFHWEDISSSSESILHIII